MKIPILITTISVVISSVVQADITHQPYRGFEGRDIASLSANDIEQLEAGAGWGLALPAELNGYPGPMHVLELGEELVLTDQQLRAFQSIFKEMKSEAIEAGKAFIAAERRLEQAFESGGITLNELRELVSNAEQKRADLRFIHLSRHLQSIKLLTEEQIEKYSKVRGYTSDPCQSVPEGHNPSMWRRHNGCDR